MAVVCARNTGFTKRAHIRPTCIILLDAIVTFISHIKIVQAVYFYSNWIKKNGCCLNQEHR